MNEITDYGDKIGGAKKDIFADYLRKLSMEIDERDAFFAQKSFSELFPKPDYADLAEKGLSRTALAAICAARGSVDRKPTGSKAAAEIGPWLRKVKTARDVAIYAMSREPSEKHDRVITEVMQGSRESVRLTFRALRQVPPESMGSVEGMTVTRYRKQIFLLSGTKTLAKVSQDAAPEHAILAAFARTMIESVDVSPKAKRTRTPEEKARTMMKSLKIYKGHDGLRSVEIRNTSGRISLGSGFESLQTARSWVSQNRPEMIRRLTEVMEMSPRERTGVFLPRQGPARRTHDVSAEFLADTFGLRGVEFGNYVEGKRRQEDLNAMWDSLSDLAEVLNVERSVIGAGGALAIAFGARGGGRAMAHFELDRRVFNLTKNSGAGSTAHEWFHWGDNAATMKNATDKEERSPKMLSALGGRVMDGLSSAWSTYEARMAEMDAVRSKPYWAKPEEMAARCFEVWLVNALADRGIRNDHLVEIDRHSEAYPTTEEMVRISPHIETLVLRIVRKMEEDADASLDIEPL